MLDRRRQSLISQIFHLSHPLLLFLLVQCHYLSTTVRAEANVTVDDGDGRITYSPPSAWRKSEQTQLNYGGSHMLTQNPNATAVFNFTGTAIYFLSPLWPYKVNTAISLDSSPPSLIDLVDHSKPDASQGSETVESNVVWSASRLSNTQHIVRVTVGAGQTYGIVDAFRYTDPSATSTVSRVVANPSFATSAHPSRSKSAVPIALGVLFGLLGIAIIFVGIWYLWRRHKRRPASEAWTVDGSAYAGANGSGRGVIPGGVGYGNGYGYGPPSAYGYESQGQPLPYPPFTYGNYAPPPPASGVPYPNVPPNRAPNRYLPGYTLSTITEKSTPQMADGTRTMPGTPMSGAVGGTALGPHSPASIQSELGYYTAGSSVGQHSPAVLPGQVGQHSESQPQLQPQHRTMGITSQMQMQGR